MSKTLIEISPQQKDGNKTMKLLLEHLKYEHGFWQEEEQNG
ncbi:hypothetical protein SCN93_05595 [Legionella pneumophila serogroup 1]